MCTRAGCTTKETLLQLSCVIALNVKKPTRVVGYGLATVNLPMDAPL